MKKITLMSLIALSAMLMTAESQARSKRGNKSKMTAEDREAKMLEKFDADGDGVLSDSEKETAKASRSERGSRSKMTSEEREAKMLEKFDANGDGILSDSEKEAAKASRPARGSRPSRN